MANKTKSTWYCSNCGDKQVKWIGQCPQCKEWNTYNEEEEISLSTSRYELLVEKENKPIKIKDIKNSNVARIKTNIAEFDNLLGGGLVPGSLSLVGGEPGIGKSTLMLQICNALAEQGLTALYVCGEESVVQTSTRARRLNISSENMLLFSETNFTNIKKQIQKIKPDIVIVDSIQIIYKPELASTPGSVSQVRECAHELMHIAKGLNITTLVIGHVTKSGEIAGPRILEHLVDTVLYFEGDKQQLYRMVRVVKNRFGATDEIAVFSMSSAGLTEVTNPSEIFIEERQTKSHGSVIIPTTEGSRPILIEAQALVTNTAYSTPSRRCAGFDPNRLALLLAVLEKKVGFKMYDRDVFVSIAGGIRIKEPATDLGILLSVASSFANRAINPNTVVLGEVGLAGEIRSIPHAEKRIKEAIHMGFERCILPKRNISGISKTIASQIELIGVENVKEAINRSLR